MSDPSRTPEGDERTGFLERPGTVRGIVLGVAGLCLLLAAADLLIHKHGHFTFETWPVFHGVFGFVAYTAIVLSAKALRRLIGRREDYYDD